MSLFTAANINYMMSIALEKIVFLPFGKLMDDYRWAIFDGSIPKDRLNAEWWKRRYMRMSVPQAEPYVYIFCYVHNLDVYMLIYVL